MMAIARWAYPADYFALYSDAEIELEAIFLTEQIRSVQKYLQEYWFIDNIEIDLPDSLPPLKGSREILRAIGHLIIGGWELTIGNISPKISGGLLTEKAIQVQIKPGTPNGRLPNVNAEFSNPGTHLFIAKSIIQQNGSQIEVLTSGEEILFRFALPVWLGESKLKN